MRLPKDFKKRLVEIVSVIPEGRVMSYSQVAAIIGTPRWARQVGQALRNYRGNKVIPWWRVINARGRISIGGDPLRPDLQKRLLLKEGVRFTRDETVPKCFFAVLGGNFSK
ncbi:MAG: hypothetical protein Kow0090_22920 [Myxococcota bacterium]